MADLTAVVWTRVTGTPRRLATVVVAGHGAVSLTYDGAAVRDRLPGISMVHALGSSGDKTYPASFANLLPPALIELAPPPHPAGRLNPQRAIVQAMAERMYRERGWRPQNQHQNEWELLLLSGRGGIGVIDVFRSDEAAERWYEAEPVEENLLLDRDGVAAAFRGIVAKTGQVSLDQVPRGGNAALPSVGGMMPKVLARLRPETGEVFLDLGGGARVTRPGIPVLVKVEPGGYGGVVELEELAFHACEDARLPVPRRWVLRPEGFRPMLAVERLDLAPDGAAEAMETTFSVLFERSGGRVSNPGAAPYEAVDALLADRRTIPGRLLRDDKAARRQLFVQVALALLTGNGDLHMRNLAFLGTGKNVRLSPVFDPAPMRAWWEHDIVAACNLGGLDLDISVPDPALGEKLLAFGVQCGIARRAVVPLVQDLLDISAAYVERVRESGAPEETKRQLLKAVSGVRKMVEEALPRLAAGADRPTP